MHLRYAQINKCLPRNKIDGNNQQTSTKNYLKFDTLSFYFNVRHYYQKPMPDNNNKQMHWQLDV